MGVNRICKQNCRFYKKEIYGHGWGESFCMLSGGHPPLNNECSVNDSVYEREMRKI